MFLIDGRNFFLSFWSTKSRDAVYNKLLGKTQNNTEESIAGVSNPMGASVLQQALFGGSPLAELTQKWTNREISNLAYIMHLNTLAGRSYNDLTQYPVFPWVLANYEAEELDLSDPNSFRNFSLPMGGQGGSRAEQFRERYDTWDDPTIPACHYGTHYSSSMIVCSFLIRLEPFTQQYLKLQGGHFDHPDRLFHSIPQSWASSSKLNTTDVRELIPEFFYLPSFLMNLNSFNFGTKQTGEVINHVVLPKWAKQSPHLFIKLHREALESDYVSEQIHNWVDLVFGYKQQGEEAAKHLNVFHYLSYEGAVDMDKILDIVEKQSTISIIHNFGQTPKQLFKKPHPKRNPLIDPPMRFDKHIRHLMQSANPIKDYGQLVSDIKLTSAGQLIVTGPSKIFVPTSYSKYLEWGLLDDSLRIFHCETNKEVAVFESLHIGRISCAIFSDFETLITGGDDTTVCIWNFISGKRPSVDLEACLRGHRKKVKCLATSRSFSVVVSGSEDCSAIIWDLNRHQYVRSLEGHDLPISMVSINDNCGDIVTCDGNTLMLWDINGNLLASNAVSELQGHSDLVRSCIPFEGRSAEVYDGELFLTGHQSGRICIWRKSFWEKGKLPWKFELLHVLNNRYGESITYLSFATNTRFFFAGDASGKISTWTLPDGSQTELHFVASDSCQECKAKFNVLGRRSNCKNCGLCLCFQCQNVIPDKNFKFCSNCYAAFVSGQ
jgi:hypothetical protein